MPHRSRRPRDRAGQLVLLRHGQSTANAAGRFTGWWDVPLTTRGRHQAREAATLLSAESFIPDVIFTSPLQRTTQTVQIVVHQLGWPEVAVVVCPQLTERAYGALTGRSKAEVQHMFGEQQSRWWRRSLTGLPPRLGEVEPSRGAGDGTGTGRPGAGVASEVLAAAEHRESLADVVTRVRTWQQGLLAPHLAAGDTVLVVAHGNSLRALVTVLDDLAADEVEALNIPTGQPLRYDVDGEGRPRPRSGRYLNPHAAVTAAQVIAAEGGT